MKHISLFTGPFDDQRSLDELERRVNAAIDEAAAQDESFEVHDIHVSYAEGISGNAADTYSCGTIVVGIVHSGGKIKK